MNLLDSFSMAWLGIGTNKGRAALTMLGVIIGVAAVIALISVGQGATAQVTSQIQALGSNLIMVSPMRNTRLTTEIVDGLPSRVPTISAAVPSVTSNMTVKWETSSESTSVEGVTPGYTSVRNFKVAIGRFITQQDVDQMSRVAVVGQQVIEDIFEGKSPLGQEISINGQKYTVVGIMDQRPTALRDGPDLDRIRPGKERRRRAPCGGSSDRRLQRHVRARAVGYGV